MGLLLSIWLTTAMTLTPILSFPGPWPKVAATAMAAGIGVATVEVVYGQHRPTTWLLAVALGAALLIRPLAVGSPEIPWTSALHRQRANSPFLSLFLFAPFLTAGFLAGSAYSIWTVIALTLLALSVTVAIGAIMSLITLVGRNDVLRTLGYTLTTLTLLTLAIGLLPQRAGWAVSAVRGGLISSAAALLTLSLLILTHTTFSAILTGLTFRRDPEGEIARGLLCHAFDLEYGRLWRNISVPERGDERAARRWARKTLARGRIPTRHAWADVEHMRQSAADLDLVIQQIHRSLPNYLAVRHEETNRLIREHARHMAAVVASWQQELLLRREAPSTRVIQQIVRCLDAAVSRQWGLFDRHDTAVENTDPRRRILAIAKQSLVAVAPLAAVAVLAISDVKLPDALLGSLGTFAFTWLAANLLRIADPRASDSLDITERLSRPSHN